MGCFSKWSTKKRIIVATVFGSALTIIGVVMIPLMNFVIKKIVEKTVVIHEGGQVYEYWLDPPVPIYLQIYMFNITNKEEFLRGGKPSLNQVGPYTYSERRVKFNITFNDNGTVSYRQKRIFTFLPDMSPGNESDLFLVPNPVYWALYNALKYERGMVRTGMSFLTRLFDEHPLMLRPFKELIWGYRDPMLNVTKALDPDWFYTDNVGFFMNKNDTDDGVYTVFTGANNISALGIIDKYNGSSYLPFWTTEYANMVNGSDGTLGPPYLPKDMVVYTFSSDICRSVPGVYVKDVTTPQGIDLWRFGGQPSALANATVNPDNIGFCTPSVDNCLGSGVINISTCQIVDFFHLPVAISFPHFLFGDKKFIDAVEGVSPNVEEHNTVVDLEPYTGLVLQAYKRLQINMYLEPLVDVPETLGLKPVFLPVFWLNESAAIDDKNAKKFFKLLKTPLLLVHIMEITLISLGGVILLSTLIYGLVKYKKSDVELRPIGENGDHREEQPGIRDEARPIINYDYDINAQQQDQS